MTFVTMKNFNKTIVIHSDMQGPCPNGFHIPLNSEWEAVKTVWSILGGSSYDGTNFGIALKLPFAGRRSRASSVSNQGSIGSYWSSSYYYGSEDYNLEFNSSEIFQENSMQSTFGLSVRGFKDSPVIPDSTWTKLYGTSIEAGGIFWSSSLGLISLSSNGTDWITIADKNVGATTVWNDGDTLLEANCGGYFQRGNNYMFPFTGTITDTSTSQVSASGYGPGNYYNSSTFIKYNGSWDSSNNTNLWGGVSQGTWTD